MGELSTGMTSEQFRALSVDERIGVTIDGIVGGSELIGSVIPDHDWGYSVIGIDDRFPLAFNGLRGEPNNGLAFIKYRESNSEAPAGVRVLDLQTAAYDGLSGVGVSWLKEFVVSAFPADWVTVNRITSGVRHRLYEERQVWSVMGDQTKLDTLTVLCGGNEDAAYSLLVVSGAVEEAKRLRPDSWVKSKFPPQGRLDNRCR